MSATPTRRGAGLLDVLLLFLAVVLLLIGPAHFSAARRPANQRACFANQKTIQGAVEMYNLDFGTHATSLDPPLPRVLEEEGYLQRYPEDPGGEGRYELLPEAPWIRCDHHGSYQQPVRREESTGWMGSGRAKDLLDFSSCSCTRGIPESGLLPELLTCRQSYPYKAAGLVLLAFLWWRRRR